MLRTFVCLVTSCLIFGTSATATVILPIEFRELVSSAAVIVHGVVVDVKSDWVDGRRAVETFVTVDVAEYLKGNLGERLTIKVPGGQLGRYRTVFVGAPTFETGDEVVLFLKSAGPSYPFIIGLTQGLFRVVADASSSRRVVTPPTILGKAGVEAEPIVRGDPARRTLPIDDFKIAVRAVLTETARGGER